MLAVFLDAKLLKYLEGTGINFLTIYPQVFRVEGEFFPNGIGKEMVVWVLKNKTNLVG